MSGEDTHGPAGGEKPKIIVDEDWKTQVEREREEAEVEKAKQPEPKSEHPELPVASFPFLVSTMVTQAMVGLGVLADPVEGKPVPHLDFARHQIDMLSVLQEKTKGNLTGEEAEMLEGSLHQLRMMFITVQSGGGAGATSQPGSES